MYLNIYIFFGFKSVKWEVSLDNFQYFSKCIIVDIFEITSENIIILHAQKVSCLNSGKTLSFLVRTSIFNVKEHGYTYELKVFQMS